MFVLPTAADLSSFSPDHSFGDNTLAESLSLSSYTTRRNCMDFDRLGHGAPNPQRARPSRRTSSPQTLEFDYRDVPHRYSSPLPQTEWRQSRDRGRGQHRPAGGAYRSVSTHYVSPVHGQFEGRYTQGGPPVSTSRSYRRRFRDLISGSGGGSTARRVPSDPTRLYPQLSSYDERFSMYSAPDEMEYYGMRSRSADRSSGYIILSSPTDSSPETYSRAQPYWPPVQHTSPIAASPNDNALAHAADYHLFVEATAGLGMQDEFTRSTSDLSERRHRIPRRPLPTRHTEPVGFVSPVEDHGSRTITSLQQLAQLPLGSQQLLPDINLQSSLGDEISPVDEAEGSEDGLPDYAESQAQAQAHLREAAARRAQELQRRWRLSGGQRGI